MIPKLNCPEWYQVMVTLNTDRISLLNLVGSLELVLRHPGLSDSTKEKAIETGRAFALRLLEDGLILPDEVARSWEKAFNIPYPVDPDRIIPELTDQEGRPWK